MSTEDLIRELEAGGVLDHPAPGPVTKKGTSAPKAPAKPSHARRYGSSGFVFLIVAVLLVAVIGSLPLGSYALYPFALFVTLLHETGHALAATLSGGSVASIQISPDQSGLTGTSGGIEALIAPAGYLGATLAGVAILLAPLRRARWVLGALAAVPLLDLLLFHPTNAFTVVWCAAFAAMLGVAAWKLPLRWAGFLQVLIGVTACLNAFRDLTTLIFISGSGGHLQTDAENMSHALFGPAYMWAVLWTVISVLLLSFAVVRVTRRELAALRRG